MRTRTKAGIVVLAAVLSLLAGAGIGSVSVSPADICRVLANRLVYEGADEATIRSDVEKLVRAYDPCLSCSVH